jgi:hypothetical protein
MKSKYMYIQRIMIPTSLFLRFGPAFGRVALEGHHSLTRERRPDEHSHLRSDLAPTQKMGDAPPTMASPNNVYYSSNGDFEEQNQFDSLLGSARQRRIGGNTPYRDDPVSKTSGMHNGGAPWTQYDTSRSSIMLTLFSHIHALSFQSTECTIYTISISIPTSRSSGRCSNARIRKEGRYSPISQQVVSFLSLLSPKSWLFVSFHETTRRIRRHVLQRLL